jgi:hypothetical protein
MSRLPGRTFPSRKLPLSILTSRETLPTQAPWQRLTVVKHALGAQHTASLLRSLARRPLRLAGADRVVGVSDERCKWPNTLSCGLAGRVANDRNTGGRESAIVERSG